MQISLLIIGFCLNAITAMSQEPTREQYLQESREQRRTAWIFLGGGLVASVVGLSLINVAGTTDGDVNNTPGAALFLSGIAATGISIPLFIRASKNKHRAMSVSIAKQQPLYLVAHGFVKKPQLLVSVQVPL
jgi:hypothetical protein